MAAPTAGYITILDSSIYNADADSITLANEGTDYCELGIPESWQHNLRTTPRVRPLFGGKGYIIKDGKCTEQVKIKGIVVSTTNLNYIMNYYKKHAVSGSDDDYICIKYASGDYHDFHDEDDSACEVAPGVFTDLMINWTNETNKTHSIDIVFNIVWS